MWRVDDYLEVIDKSVARLQMLLELIPEDDEEARDEVEMEISQLGELREKIQYAYQNLTIFTVH